MPLFVETNSDYFQFSGGMSNHTSLEYNFQRKPKWIRLYHPYYDGLCIQSVYLGRRLLGEFFWLDQCSLQKPSIWLYGMPCVGSSTFFSLAMSSSISESVRIPRCTHSKLENPTPFDKSVRNFIRVSKLNTCCVFSPSNFFRKAYTAVV